MNILENVKFTQLQDDEAEVRGLGEKLPHHLHLDPHQILIEDSRVQAVWLVQQLRSFHSVVEEVDVGPLPLILTSFAIHGVFHKLVKIILNLVLGGPRASGCSWRCKVPSTYSG